MLERPAHPYTRALLAAVPKLDSAAGLEMPLRGTELPSNRRLPTGCYFRERCPFAVAGVIPNPWDAGSAVWLQQAGFKALATTSSGYAWTLALPDNGVGLEGMVAHLKAIVAAAPSR